MQSLNGSRVVTMFPKCQWGTNGVLNASTPNFTPSCKGSSQMNTSAA